MFEKHKIHGASHLENGKKILQMPIPLTIILLLVGPHRLAQKAARLSNQDVRKQVVRMAKCRVCQC